MAKIGLSEGFSLVPEGTHVFKIITVNYKEDFGKMEVVMQTQSGLKHTERFSLLKSDGEPNEGALNAFSYFAKVAPKAQGRQGAQGPQGRESGGEGFQGRGENREGLRQGPGKNRQILRQGGEGPQGGQR